VTRRNAYITQSQLVNFAGSEISTVEIANELKAMGYEVYVVTTISSKTFRVMLAKKGIKVLHVLEKNIIQQAVEDAPPDLVWVQHNIFPIELSIEAVKNKAKIFFYHMSGSTPQELPFFRHIEEKIASLIVVNSAKGIDIFYERRWFNKSTKNLFNLKNSAPDIFFDEKKNLKSRPKKLLVVSNHIPDELREAGLLLLKNNDIEVFDHIGDGGNVKANNPVTPGILKKYDVVITIGKTVQYCMAMGIPVYCYDHYGGPGYLVEGNLESSAQRNFSGRGAHKSDAAGIARELLRGYSATRLFTQSTFRKVFAEEHRLSKKIRTIIESEDQTKTSARDVVDDLVLMDGYTELVSRRYANNHYLRQKNHTVEQELDALQQTNNRLSLKLNEITSSRAYKTVINIQKMKKKLGL